MPTALKVLALAARHRFNLDHAKQSYQLRTGGSVPWDDTFVDELKSGLIACRVMFVKPPSHLLII